MKKVFLVLMGFIASLILVSCSDEDNNERVSFSEISETAKSFLIKHFTDFNEFNISYIEKDSDGTYEVMFNDRTEIDFYPNGIWKEIDLNGNTLPNSIAMLLPENALSYISSTYPNAIIEEIEKTGPYSENGQGFKIELRNDRDIYFDAKGDVLKDKGEESKGKETVKVESLPTTSQEFLNTYFKGQTPDRIEKEWNKYEVEYKKNQTEVEVEFFASDGSFKSIEADNGTDIIRPIIQGELRSTSILDYLDENHLGQAINEFSIAASGITIEKGYVVEIDGKPDYKIYFDLTGKHIQTVRD